MAQEKFSESTLGVPAPKDFDGDVNHLPDAILWKTLFDTKTFRISVVPDVEGVGLCGALKSWYIHLSTILLLTESQILSLLQQGLLMAWTGAPTQKVLTRLVYI